MLGGEANLGAALLEELDASLAQRGGTPLPLVAGEEGESGRPNLFSVERSVLHTSRTAHMCSYIFHSKSFFRVSSLELRLKEHHHSDVYISIQGLRFIIIIYITTFLIR